MYSRMRIVTCLAGILTSLHVSALWLIAGTRVHAANKPRWVVCYSDRPSPFDLARYDVVVLDPDRRPNLGPMVDRNRTILGYLSLTQMGRERTQFRALADAGVVLGEHPIWKGAHYLDFRRPEWTRVVIEEIVPRALSAGFSGLFLDTLDDAEFLERQDPVKFKGMRAAAIQLVHAIRHHFPAIVLMANRGYAVMPEIAGSIDMVLGESVLATFDPDTRAYRLVAPRDVEWQVNALRAARAVNPRLKIFTLDYWDPSDRQGIRRLYETQRRNGFIPYVSTPMLDTVVQEP
jgi:polysaccharide biosynthesis protein PelA